MNLDDDIALLQEDLELYNSHLALISKELREMDVSKYPIFVAYPDEYIEVGKPLVLKSEIDSHWSINISHLEEFVNKDLVNIDLVDEFRAVYKNPDEFLCIFIINNENAGFVFAPIQG